MIVSLFEINNSECSTLNDHALIEWLWECTSTQTILIKWASTYYNKSIHLFDHYILAAHSQTSGIGQYQRIWESDEQSLCFSLLTKPHDILNLSSLEIGTLIVDFFLNQFNIQLFLKWPNDLLTENGNKVGGLLTWHSDHNLVVGIGLNLNLKILPLNAANIFSSKFNYSKKQKLLSDLISFIINNRHKNAKTTHDSWMEKCFRLGSNVQMTEDKKNYEGIFFGIDLDGSLLVKIKEPQDISQIQAQTKELSSDIIRKFYTGNLIYK